MTDWTKSTGSTGTMMIRDTGTTVEFWLRAGSATYNHQLPWKYTVNGSTSAWKEFDFKSGGAWQRLGSWNVTYSQTVTFYLGNTGTSGLGGPTTFSHAISRAKVPAAPSPITFSQLDHDSVRCSFTDGSNGGSAINQRQIGYGTSANSPQTTVNYSGPTVIGGLASGVRYYFWARCHNAVGWGPYSARRDIVTWRVPFAPTQVQLSEVKQTSVKAVFNSTGDGGTPVLEWQLGYGLSPTTQQQFLSSSGTSTVTNLLPGRTYYFWARGRNAVGWGPWSVVNSVQLVAGAWVRDGTTWKRAVPWVNVNGVWRVAKAWGKVAGSWRESL